jgi:hypothetical protein
MFYGHFQCPLGNTHALGCHIGSRTVEKLHETAKTMPFFTDQIFSRHIYVLENYLRSVVGTDTELSFELVSGYTLAVSIYDDNAVPLMAGFCLRVCEAESYKKIGNRAIGNEHF